MKRYSSVGPPEIAASAEPHDVLTVHNGMSLESWLGGPRTCTYIVAVDGLLRLASRHSEHVACAAGEDVLAAGEITFTLPLAVVAVSNQSTGYCPEVSCWPAVARALDQAGIAHPGGFTDTLEFRRCPACGQINIVRDSDFACAVCDSSLPEIWNF